MLKKMLLTLDGSENAEKAVPWVLQFAGREKALVILFQAVPQRTDRKHWQRERDAARDYLMRIERELQYRGIPTKILIRRGPAAREIVDVAAEQGCDLIVMSTRGGSTVKRWAIGGVTEQVMRRSRVPVLPVWSSLERPVHGHVSRLIVPLDGSKRAEAVVWWSIGLAQLLKSKLVYLHVRSRSGEDRAFAALQKRLLRICQSLDKQGLKAEFTVQSGDPAEQILRFADRNDLILTTTHGFGGMKRWVFGSVAETLVHAGTSPVLVYKQPA